MRTIPLLIATAVLLAGCYGTGDSASGGWSEPAATSAEIEARVANWEAQWAEARRDVTEARAEAVASGQPIAPEVDAEVTELLDRDLQSSDPEVRIENLQDAVSDALRLAELVSIG